MTDGWYTVTELPSAFLMLDMREGGMKYHSHCPATVPPFCTFIQAGYGELAKIFVVPHEPLAYVVLNVV